MNKEQIMKAIEEAIETQLNCIVEDIKNDVINLYTDYIMDDIGDIIYNEDDHPSYINSGQSLNDIVKTVNKLQNMSGDEVGNIDIALAKIGLSLDSIHKAHGVYQIEASPRK